VRYGVFYSPAAQREIVKLARRRERRRILDAIDKLASDPRPPGSRKLTNSPLWRIRVGDHRVIYSIDDDGSAAVVLRVAHRTRVYEVDLADLQRRAGEAIRRPLPGEGHRSP
jgi:mRNA interferase RelE/StbE